MNRARKQARAFRRRIPADRLLSHPKVVDLYTRWCLGRELAEDELPEGMQISMREARPIWDDFIDALMESADIEILEPALR